MNYKATCVLLLAVLSLALCDTAASVDANTTDTNISVAKSAANDTAPQLTNVDKDTKTDDLGKGSQEGTKKKHEEDISNATKDKTETKEKDSNANQSLEGGSNSTKLPLEESPMEGCDPSNSCFNGKNKYNACLRVPGQDFLDLSLLIQNEGTTALDVNIIAPDFVSLEKTMVNIPEKQNKEVTVRVFVKDGVSDTTITLNAVDAADGNCSLNLRNMIPTSVRSETSRVARYFSVSSRTFSIGLFLAAVVLAGAAWLCIKLWRKSVPRYQKVDVVLPVSTGGNKETDEADCWDNSWGDDWDDEAPKTPSKLVSTPSSKGLATRRLIKDGWKD